MGLACVLESCDIIPQCIKGLQISDISQQVKIKVDEQGTEAAAVPLWKKQDVVHQKLSLHQK